MRAASAETANKCEQMRANADKGSSPSGPQGKCEQMRTNANKRGQMRTNVNKREQMRTNANKREQTRTNANKREQTWTNVNKCEQMRTNVNKREQTWTSMKKRKGTKRVNLFKIPNSSLLCFGTSCYTGRFFRLPTLFLNNFWIAKPILMPFYTGNLDLLGRQFFSFQGPGCLACLKTGV